MIGASKILTVSYGTFSCTLEGFDDPFNTMKAIAEYFRDLAADDRYFGAEPPTPDAAMLHKIAERELQRRVEAQVGEHGVVLRADDSAPPKVTIPAHQPLAQPPLAAASVFAPTVATEAEANHAMESAAARLSRLRAAQTQILGPRSMTVAASAPVMGDIRSRFADVEAYVEDQDLGPVMAPVATPAAAIPEHTFAPVAEDVQPFAWVQDAALETDDNAIAPLPPSNDALDMADAFVADSPAQPEPIMASLRETLAGLTSQDDQLVADIAETAEAAPGFGDFEDMLPESGAAFAGAFEAAEVEAASELAPAAAFDDAIDDIDQSDLDDLAALDSPVSMADDAAEIESQDQADAATVDVDDSDDDDADPVESAALADILLSPDAPVVADKIQRARARVIKIRRLDKGGAEAAPTLSPEAEADLQNTLAALGAEAAPVVATQTPMRTVRPTRVRTVIANLTPAKPAEEPKPEAEPVSEAMLAAVQDVMLEPVAEAMPDVEAEVEAVAELEADAMPVSASVAEKPVDIMRGVADEAAVDRLIAQTNSELEVPEVKRRRSAIAHLKAAVLATVADGRNSPKAKADVAEVKMNPYRLDLNHAVRPLGATGSNERPAPLVLVSAQRIDRKRDAAADANRPVPQIVGGSDVTATQPTPAAPQSNAGLSVRPRRVGASGRLAQAVSSQLDDEDELEVRPNFFADGTKQSFADFAESLGTRSLSELIEAAGAYCTLVLEQPSFSRPLLFEQISSMAEQAKTTREDTLRFFGKLLRDGRIQKTARGQFALSETSPILTEAKRIAG